MELAELLRKQRSTPRRCWDIASSEHWYDGDDFWLEMIVSDPVYREAMIETEQQLIQEVCNAAQGSAPGYSFVALGPGDAAKESQLYRAVGATTFIPIDVNEKQLEIAGRSVEGTVKPIKAEFREGLRQVRDEKPKFIYLGATYSNTDAFDYDLLSEIQGSMDRGDKLYVSVQTFPCSKDLPLLTHQYENMFYRNLDARLAQAIGAEVANPFTQFEPVRSNLEVGSVVTAVSGVAAEVGVRPGDKLVTMISHKPKALRPELEVRFGERYAIQTYRTQRPVQTPDGPYTSTFEAAILEKR